MRRHYNLHIIAAAILFLFLTVNDLFASSGLKVGVAKVKITPEEPTILGGYSHGTIAECDPSTDILDDIYCRILVVEDQAGTREVFLSMDVCVYMESDYYDPYNGYGVWWPKTVATGTTQRFADAGGVSLNRVFVSATHTHQASEQLSDKYIQRIIDGINTAKNNMVDVNVGYANTRYDLNVNRRPDFGVHPDLECDKSLIVAIFRNSATDAPVASMINYSIHNTGIGTGGNGFNKCSSELTGIAMDKIESTYGGDFVSLFIQGFEGDVGPSCFGRPGAPYNTVVSLGNTFGQDCADILNGITVSNNPMSVNGTVSSQALNTKPGWGVPSVGVSFTGARIGDICFVGGSGEIFNQMGVSLRLQSPFGTTVTAGLVNGYSGYVPTYSGFNDGVGGAEVSSKCPWVSDIENTFMTEMSKIVSTLAGGTSILGYSSIGSNSEIIAANTLTISKCNSGANMSLNTLKIFVQNSTGKVRLGLYADNGTDTPALLQQTGEITLVNGWNEGSIPSTNIVPGTYWIGFIFSNDGNEVYYDKRRLGSYSKSYAYGTLPSNPTGMNWGGGMYSVFSGTVGTSAQVTSVSVTPSSSNIYVNATKQLTATVSPSNAANKTIIWSSENALVATVSNTGLVTGIAPGSVNITATTQDGSKTSNSLVNVNSAVLVSGVSLDPTAVSISVNSTQQLTATLSPSDATNKTIIWSSNNPSVAIVSNAGLVTAVTAGLAVITATTEDGSKTATSSITVNNDNGSTIGLSAIGNGTEKGDNGFWVVSSFISGSDITVNRMNLYVGSASGTARLGLYSTNSGQPGTLLAQTGEIPLSNGWNSGMLDLPQTLIPGVMYWLAFEVSSSSTTLYFNSAEGSIRYKSYAYGALPPASPSGLTSDTGIYSIFADYIEGISNPVTGVSVSPGIASISVNGTQQLTATVLPADATNKTVIWSSGNPMVATVNNSGMVTGESTGSTTITATTQDGSKKATCTITVTSAGSVIGLNAVGSTTEKNDKGFWIANSYTTGSNMTVNRMNIYVSNAAGNARLGLYSSNSGQPGALLAQTSEILLSNGWNSVMLDSPQSLSSGVTYWLAFEVNSSATTLFYNSAPGRLRYKSLAYGSLPSTAPTALGSGTGIYSMYADFYTPFIPVSGVLVSPSSASIYENETQQFTTTIFPSDATNKTVSWSSGNTLIATVSNSGLVTGVSDGSAIITATTEDGSKTSTCVITVSTKVTGVSIIPTSTSIYENESQQLSADFSPSNATNRTVTWSSDNNLVATISSSGLVTGVAPGIATITVTTEDGGKTATCVITVKSALIPVMGISLSPSSAEISEGDTLQLRATILPYNATNQIVSWNSDNNSIATVSSTGLVTAITSGNATITATSEDGSKTSTCLIAVGTLGAGLSLSPSSASINEGETLQLSSKITPPEETNETLSWISDNVLIATVDNNGLVTGVSPGNALITATNGDGSKTDSCVINVSTKVSSLRVEPNSASIYLNDTLQLNATILPLNASNKTLVWSSSNSLVAAVNSRGLLTGVGAGSVIITVTTEDGSKFATSVVTVNIPVTNVNVDPTSSTIYVNETKQLSANILPFEATNKNSTWNSDNTLVATVSSSGLVTGISPGSATITITTEDGNKTASSVITVNPAPIPVSGISLSLNSAIITENETLQLTETILPSNATNKTVSWSSDNPLIATVSNTGLITGIAVGSAVITVTTENGNKTASCALTVRIPVAGVSVSPGSANITVSSTKQLTTTISPTNATNKLVNWSSGNISIATVSNTGLVTAVTAGTTTITATTQDGGKTATCTVTVSGDGSTIGLNTIGNTSEKGDNGYWVVSSFTAGSNVTVNRMNLYVGNASGNARLGLYSSSSGQPGTLLAQTGEIPLSNGWNSGMLDAPQALTSGVTYWLAFEVNSSATALYYNSAEGNIKYKSYAYGSLPSAAPTGLTSDTGTYSIYADNSGGTTIPVTGVSVSPTSASITINNTQQLTATILPSDATYKAVIWSSGNTSVATVTSTGIVTAIAAGSTSITATTQDGGKTAACTVTVSGDVSTVGLNTLGGASEKGISGFWIVSSFTAGSNITVNRMNLYVGTATGNARLGLYSSSSGQPGILLAQTGEIPLSNGWNSGILDAPQNLTSGVTYWLAFEVNSSATTLYYNSASGRQRYKSYAYGSLPSSAPTGLASGTGIYSIYADNSGGTTIQVTGVSVSPTTANISVNNTQQLNATILPSDATYQSVIWSSGNTSVATVSSSGLVTAVAAGSTTITATTQDGGKTATCTVTVSGNVSSVGLNTVGSASEKGISSYWIVSSFTAGSNITVNRMNLYVGTASGKARLGLYSNSSGQPGNLLAQTGEISLSNGWNNGMLDAPQTLTSGVTYWLAFEVSSSATTLYYNSASGRQRYKSYAYGPLPSIAPTGLALGTGIYSIYADFFNTTIPITGVSVSPTSASISVNTTQQLIATILPSNATNQAVNWSSNNTIVATVSNTGLVTAVSEGSATITVTTEDGGKTATSLITVAAAPNAQGMKIAYPDENINTIIGSGDIQNKFLVYPNPVTDGFVFVNFSTNDESATINIVDLSGRLVYNKMLMKFDIKQQLDITDLKAGIYLIKVTQGGSRYIGKLIVDKKD